MWIYHQSTGELWKADAAPKTFDLQGTGYAGHEDGRNNSAKEGERNVGPIPKGLYRIGAAYHSDRCGPITIPLDPVNHDCLGRTDMRMHGNNRTNDASNGCIIQGPEVRKRVAQDEGQYLVVVD